MPKYILTIIITITFLNSQTNLAKDLFLLQPDYTKITVSGKVLYCFDNYNTSILLAKHEIIKELFIPSSNCQYSNLIQENKKKYQTDIDNKNLRNKNTKKDRIIAILCGLIVILIAIK